MSWRLVASRPDRSNPHRYRSRISMARSSTGTSRDYEMAAERSGGDGGSGRSIFARRPSLTAGEYSHPSRWTRACRSYEATLTGLVPGPSRVAAALPDAVRRVRRGRHDSRGGRRDRVRRAPRVLTLEPVMFERSGVRADPILEPLSPSCIRLSAQYPIEPPAVGDALELVFAGVLEGEPGAGNQILHGLRDEHL